MDPKSLTDQIIQQLLRMPKRVKNPKARQTAKAKHQERNYDVAAVDGAHEFVLITRQSTVIPENFSCGLVWVPAPGHRVILARYNGYDHIHSNPIEETGFEYKCHIHIATERYIQAGRKAEMFAEPTTRYETLGDALKCLTEDCNIQGLTGTATDEDAQIELFK